MLVGITSSRILLSEVISITPDKAAMQFMMRLLRGGCRLLISPLLIPMIQKNGSLKICMTQNLMMITFQNILMEGDCHLRVIHYPQTEQQSVISLVQ